MTIRTQLTADDGARARSHDRAEFFTPSKISPKQSMTPEGFLLCVGVPIARTGEMLYAAGEVPVEATADGLVRIARDAVEVFRPETIASFEGKPVTVNHPDDFVSPETWRELAVGTVMNVRQGSGVEDDYLLADLLITAQEGIEAVRKNGLREVSCGYDAEYEQAEPGRGVQRNILGNHVALVSQGRCGPRCAIGDQTMATKNRVKDFLMRAFKAKDAAEVEKICKEAEDAEVESAEEKAERERTEKAARAGDAATRLVLDKLDALSEKLDAHSEQIKALEDAVADDDDDDDGKKAKDRKAKDKSAWDAELTAEEAEEIGKEGVKLYTGDVANTIVARAAILAPDLRIPTLDAKTSDAKRAVALCRCQRSALDAAYKTAQGKAAIDPFLGGFTADFGKLPTPLVNAAFHAAAQIMKAGNNADLRASVTTRDFGKRSTVADINAANRKFWAERLAK